MEAVSNECGFRFFGLMIQGNEEIDYDILYYIRAGRRKGVFKI